MDAQDVGTLAVGQRVRCTEPRFGCYGMIGVIMEIKPFPHHEPEQLITARLEGGGELAGGLVDLRVSEIEPA